MYETRNYNNNNKYIYLTIILGVTLLLFYSLFFKHQLIADSLLVIGFLIIVSYYDIQHKMSSGAFLLVIVAITLSLLGAMGLYAHFIWGIIGYDKLVHLISSFAVAYALIELSSQKQNFFRYSSAILVVMGLGAIVEINEFIGTAYFGLNNGGIFTIGDNLSTIKSDLQRYDTYFDLITNLLGAFTAVSFVILRNKIWKNKHHITNVVGGEQENKLFINKQPKMI